MPLDLRDALLKTYFNDFAEFIKNSPMTGIDPVHLAAAIQVFRESEYDPKTATETMKQKEVHKSVEELSMCHH